MEGPAATPRVVTGSSELRRKATVTGGRRPHPINVGFRYASAVGSERAAAVAAGAREAGEGRRHPYRRMNSLCQNSSLPASDTSTTTPLAAVVVCLVDVALFAAASLTHATNRPLLNDGDR